MIARLSQSAVLLSLALFTAQARADGLDRLEGPAAPVLRQALSKVMIDCPSRSGKCAESGLVDEARLFYGSFEGSDEKYALAFISYEAGGNSDVEDAILLHADKNGDFKFAAKGSVTGANPRDVRFRKDGIYYVGTIMGPNDSHASPSEPKAFMLSVHDRQLISQDTQLVHHEPQWVLFDQTSMTLPSTGAKISLNENFGETVTGSKFPDAKINSYLDEGRPSHSFTFKTGDGFGFDVLENPKAAPHVMAIVSNHAANVLGIRTGMRANDVPGIGAKTCSINELFGTYECQVQGYSYILDIDKCGLDKTHLPDKLTYVDDCMIVDTMAIGDY